MKTRASRGGAGQERAAARRGGALFLLLACGCAAAPRAAAPGAEASSWEGAQLGAPVQERHAGPSRMGAPGEAAFDIVIDCGALELGAYELELRYDPARVRLLEVGWPGAGAFPAFPQADARSFASGATAILGLLGPGAGPRGPVAIARVRLRFLVPLPPSPPLAIDLRALYTPTGEAIEGAVRLQE